MDYILNTFLLLVGLVFLSYILSSLWRSVFKGQNYSIIILPGVVIHELSHLIGCFITFAKVKDFKLFSFKGGYVRHKKPKLPIVGQPIISSAPLFGGTFSLFLIYKLTGLRLPNFNFSLSFVVDILNIIRFNLTNYFFWIVIYLSVSILISIIPSRKDFKNSIFNLLVLFAIFILIDNFFRVNNLTFFNSIINTLSFIFSVGILALLPSLLIYLLKSIFD